MKITHAGDLTVDGEPRIGVFLSGTRQEVADALSSHLVGDEVALMCALDYENWLSGQEDVRA